MATYRTFIVLALLITTFAVAAPAKLLGQTGKPSTDAARSDSSKLEFFEKHVRPLLIEKCYECHSHESGESDGDLFLDSAAAMRKGGSRGAVLVAGKPNQSLLMRVVNVWLA